MAYEQRVTRRQKLRYNSTNDDNPLVYQLVVDGAKVTPDSATIAITDPAGDEVLAATAMGKSGTLLSKAVDTTTVADFPIDEGYRADIVTTYNALTYDDKIMIDVVRFLFRLNVGFDQLVAMDDGIRGMKHDGDEDFSALVVAVEDEINNEVEKKVIKDKRMLPEMILDPSRLGTAAKLRMLYYIFNEKKDYDHADRYEKRYMIELRSALNSIQYDVDQDGFEDNQIGGWQAVRLVQ